MMERRFILIFLLSCLLLDLVDCATYCTIESTGVSGECTLLTECPEVMKEYTKLKKMPTICDKKYRTICCPLKTTMTSTMTLTTTQTPRRISEKKCQEYEKFVDGLNRTCPTGLIIGGTPAKKGEFPHMALIGYGEGEPEDFHCGGSLISDEWILSAAHCSKNRISPALFAKVGILERSKTNSNSQTYSIIQRISHPKYISRFADDDIALFKLNERVQFNLHVIPLCLPKSDDGIRTENFIATGWGREGFAEDPTETLMKVTLENAEKQKCEETYEEDSRLEGKQINWSKMICAGSNNKTGDTCSGDSGGPIQILNKNCMYTIVGVTSYGPAYCGSIGIPAIYTRVSYYLNWIESIVWPGM